MERSDLKNCRRVVVKVGTSSITHKNGKFDIQKMDRLCRELADLHNRGYGTEALRLTLDALFARGFETVRAGFFEENAASRRVMEKNGMTPTGEEETIDWRGASHRCLYYAIRREDAR